MPQASSTKSGNWSLFDLGTRQGKVAVGILCLVIVAAAAVIVYWYRVQSRPGSGAIPRVKWTKPFGGTLMLGKDGDLYVADSNKLYALDSDGAIRWAHGVDLNDRIVGGLLQDSEGNIYFATDKKMYSLSASGVKRWESECPAAEGEVNYQTDGALDETTVYEMCNGNFSAFNKDNGKERWRLPALQRESTPVVLKDGTLIVVRNWHIVAVNQDGNTLWTYPPEGEELGDAHVLRGFSITAMAVGADENLYVGLGFGRLAALTREGKLKWKFDVDAPLGFQSSPVIASDGTVIAVSAHGRVYAFTPEGEVKWLAQFQDNRMDLPSPVLGNDGIIYVPGGQGIVAFSAEGRKIWELPLRGTPSPSQSPTLAPDGTLYFSTYDSTGDFVYAIQTASRGLMKSPWPKYQRDLANSGHSPTVIN